MQNLALQLNNKCSFYKPVEKLPGSRNRYTYQ